MDGYPFPPSSPLQNGTIEVKQINPRIDAAGNLQYFGELINKSTEPACDVQIYIDSKDPSGGPDSIDFDFVQGSTLLVSSFPEWTCLNPNEVGAFDVASPLHSSPASLSSSIYWNKDNISTPKVTSAEVVVEGLTESTGPAGNRVLVGSIKNKNSHYTLSQVRIAFAAIDAGEKVIDTQLNFINGSDCQQAGNNCLTAGASGSFSVPLAVLPSEAKSYKYKINYNVMEQ
ncbi:MAG: hypothetical protein HY282_03210 [Nitrospirae bacterium]|nr:hypothetical protein [Candidatus Manganitrophaceae bacterium]